MTKYRKSWTQALQEVFNKLDKVVEEAEIDEWAIEESAGLQLKMAFDDAKIKIKGVKSGKLVIAKKDKKEVEKIIAKQMKKPSDAKRVLGSQIVFEEVEIEEIASTMYGIVKGTQEKGKVVFKGSKRTALKKLRANEFGPNTILINAPSAKVGDKWGKGKTEEVELAEKGTAYPATVDTLRKIVKDKQHQTVMFDKGQALVDLFTASAMVQVYDALKPATKKKFEDMIKSKEGFMKSQAFAMKMAK